MDACREIQKTKEMLIKYGELYTSRHPIRVNEPPFPICGHDIIHKAINYGIRTCISAYLLIDNSQFENAAIVTRPFLELALRMVWCRQVTDGWQRVVAYLAKETLAAVQAEEDIVGSCPISEKAKNSLLSIAAQKYNKLPNLWEMLDEIAKKQSSEAVSKNIKESYAIFFKGSLHQMAHANLCYMAFEQKDRDKYRISRAIKRSGIWVINASHDYIDMSPKDVEQFINKWVEGFSLSDAV